MLESMIRWWTWFVWRENPTKKGPLMVASIKTLLPKNVLMTQSRRNVSMMITDKDKKTKWKAGIYQKWHATREKKRFKHFIMMMIVMQSMDDDLQFWKNWLKNMQYNMVFGSIFIIFGSFVLNRENPSGFFVFGPSSVHWIPTKNTCIHFPHFYITFSILPFSTITTMCGFFSGPGSMHLNKRLCGPGFCFLTHIQSIIDDHRDRIEYQTAFDYGSNSSSIQFWWDLFAERRRIHTLIGYLFISTMLLLFQKSNVDWNALLLNELLPFTYSKMVSVLPRFRPHHRTHTNHSDFYVVEINIAVRIVFGKKAPKTTTRYKGNSYSDNNRVESTKLEFEFPFPYFAYLFVWFIRSSNFQEKIDW